MISLPDIELTESEQIEVLAALAVPSMQKYLKAQVVYLAQDMFKYNAEEDGEMKSAIKIARTQGQAMAYEALLTIIVPPQSPDSQQ
jgi:hypothetical protein